VLGLLVLPFLFAGCGAEETDDETTLEGPLEILIGLGRFSPTTGQEMSYELRLTRDGVAYSIVVSAELREEDPNVLTTLMFVRGIYRVKGKLEGKTLIVRSYEIIEISRKKNAEPTGEKPAPMRARQHTLLVHVEPGTGVHCFGPGVASARAGKDGIARLEGLAAGLYGVNATTEGKFAFASVEVGAATEPLKLTLLPARLVDGRVTEAGGQPRAGVVVTVESGGRVLTQSITDAEGWFSVTAPTGRFSLCAGSASQDIAAGDKPVYTELTWRR